mmetsp:Transcript_71485/g.205022  ORF Transcript_71485/g.205022 Transcript_71485/m.205022 type:complete len:485 (-) Transcript_71485:40-1494(-)
MEGYQAVRKISEGRFGTVSEAISLATGQRVAIKRVWARKLMPGLDYDPWARSAEREIEVLGRVQHEHIIQLLDHHVALGAVNTALVYPLMAWDLATVLERKRPFDESVAKVAMRMLLLGVAHLHKCSVMHRDLKPANILVEGGTGVLKIADFGSSRVVSGMCWDENSASDAGTSDGSMTRDVCTRWFKSPEMLFGSLEYDAAVDLWAAGCLFGELLSPKGKPLFPGGADLEQICLIFQTLGTPNVQDWPEVRRLPDYRKVEFVPRDPKPLDWEGQRSPQAMRLLYGLLRLNPARRLRAHAALAERCFAEAPAVAEPRALVEDLVEDERPCRGEPDDSEGSEGSFEGGSVLGLDSGGSSLGGFGDAVGGRDPEAFAVETTTCGLWDSSAGPLDCEPVGPPVGCGEPDPVPAPRRNRTPSPPRCGAHRLKADVLQAYDRGGGDSGPASPADPMAAPSPGLAPAPPRRSQTPLPTRVAGGHRLKARR